MPAGNRPTIAAEHFNLSAAVLNISVRLRLEAASRLPP